MTYYFANGKSYLPGPGTYSCQVTRVGLCRSLTTSNECVLLILTPPLRWKKSQHLLPTAEEAAVFFKAGTSLEYMICSAQFTHDKPRSAWYRRPDVLKIQKVITAQLSRSWAIVIRCWKDLLSALEEVDWVPGHCLFDASISEMKYLMRLSPLMSDPRSLYWPLEHVEVCPMTWLLFFFALYLP